MKIFNSLLALIFILTIIACSPQQQQNESYSIVGSWKLIGMQLDGTSGEQKIDSTLSQSDTRFVYEKTGQFKMVLSSDGRGLQGGYLYNPETNILSIRYGNQVDTALVNWVNVNRMVHTTTDGKTITVLEREKTLKR
jgi:ABC-type uncharacterized transport system auxiliary subunit